MNTTNLPLSKSQLAHLYSPDLKTSAALNRLSRWIKGDSELTDALHQAGYHPHQRILTSRQVQIILDYLGDPRVEPELVGIMEGTSPHRV